ncbi:unnamed protein product [Eruca vesicaria subsp. sativa]|uniref:Uncharacterized protein n=1 Tax=Eruca vesicaria subsp. sativa TaxID=29727 RepID=A0ABC8LRJ4_ERUVS|nr:unnamed protein product [Eruca vesicaria subsp. sativa]
MASSDAILPQTAFDSLQLDSKNIKKQGEFMGITLLLSDEMDSLIIHGFIPAARAAFYCPSLREGSVLQVSRFEVARCTKTNKITDEIVIPTVEVRFSDLSDRNSSWKAYPKSFEYCLLKPAGEPPSSRAAHVQLLSAPWSFFRVALARLGILPMILWETSSLSDAWALDTAQKPYVWQRLNPDGYRPSARMYASGSASFDGMFLLCGGRDKLGAPLGDASGLLMHRNGQWEWILAPGVAPSPRYQHSAVFVGARLHISGGVLRGDRMIDAEATVAGRYFECVSTIDDVRQLLGIIFPAATEKLRPPEDLLC